MSFRADLHCHTLYSDGSFDPKALIAEAKMSQLQGLSITDHDTTAAYAEAVPLAKEAGILLGTGIELSCECLGHSVHILCYDYPLNHSVLHSFCEAHQKRRRNRNQRILEKLSKIKFFIDESEIDGLGRPHIAKRMVEKGYVKSFREAFLFYIGEGKPCYDRGEPFSVQETIELIHEVEGKAFIAHPHVITSNRLLGELLKLPFDGIECYYARSIEQQERKWLKIAKEKNWLISGGSDFHGEIKPHIPLGCSWVGEEQFFQIFQRLLP
jgi:3',5'-nucleoside bisphosphate phosphatase